MTSTKAKLEFVWAMAHHTRATVRQCEALLRYAATLDRLAVKQCNEPWTDADQAKRDRIKRKVTELCDEMALDAKGGKLFIGPQTRLEYIPVFSNDPRGAVLKIRVPDGFTNDFGGEGICVPA